MSAQTVALSELLVEAFSVPEARRLVRGLDCGDDVLSEVSENLGGSVHADQVVDALYRRGALDDAFFLALLQKRPRLRDRIVPLWDTLSVGVPDTSSPVRGSALPRLLIALSPFTVALLACLFALTLSQLGRAFSPTEAGTLVAPVLLALADLPSLLRGARTPGSRRLGAPTLLICAAALLQLVVALLFFILDLGLGPLGVLVSAALAVGALTLAARAHVERDPWFSQPGP